MYDYSRCVEYFRSVKDWAKQNNLEKEFSYWLDYLDTYACRITEKLIDTSLNKVEMYKTFDLPEHSFGLNFYKLDKRTGLYGNCWMNAGLVYFESDNDWSIHS